MIFQFCVLLRVVSVLYHFCSLKGKGSEGLFFYGQKFHSAFHSSDEKVEICSISSAPLTFVLPGLPLVPVLLSSACSAGMVTMTIAAVRVRRTDRIAV